AANPDNARVMRVVRDIYSELGDFTALEALYGDKGNFEELCETLQAIADRTNNAAARLKLLQRVAELAQTKLQQPERALKAYEKILATDPDNRAAAQAAAAIYRATERWGRLLATYEILLGGKAAAPKDSGAGSPEPLAARDPLAAVMTVPE